MRSSSGLPSYRWLVVAVAVAAGVYGWHAFNQYDRLNHLNHRQLSNAGSELTAAIGQAVATIDEFNTKWRKAPAGRPLNVCDFVNGQPYLSLSGCDANVRSASVAWSNFTSATAVADTVLGIRVARGKDTRKFTYRTDTLLQELAFSDAFSLIFVANEKGAVVAQDTPRRRQWLRHLRWGEQVFRDGYLDRAPALQVHDVQQLVGGADAWNKLRAVTSRTTVTLGGVPHELYLQPLVLGDSGSVQLIVGGAVPRASIIVDALALGTSMVGVMVLLVLFGLLGLPFIKLAVLDRRERFRKWDIVWLYSSSGALLVLLTCGSLALDGSLRWRSGADRGLREFAGRLEEQFVREVTAVRDQLVTYDQQVSELGPRKCNVWPVRANWFTEKPKPELAWPDQVHLRTVAWIGPDGWQIWKSTADPVPGKTFVGQRLYFRAIRDRNLFRLDDDGPALFLGPDRSIADGRFYTFISMPSQVDSRKLCSDARAAPLTLSATTQLLSLERQPLPAGYGFAVINRSGSVLYHSDGRLSLRENLFDELADGERARALIYAGIDGGLATRYRARPHRFYLRPIGLFRTDARGNAAASTLDTGSEEGDSADDGPPGGFYLAVFRDTSVEQTLIGHVFAVGLVGPMALLIGLTTITVGLLTLVAVRRGHSPIVWLWPHRGLTHVYQSQSAAFLALLLVAGSVYGVTGSVTLLLLMPVLAIVIGVAIYRFGAGSMGPRASLNVTFWQRSAVMLALVCLIVMPSAALFTVALNHQFAKLIVTEQQWIDAQRDDLQRAMYVETRDGRYADSRTNQLLKVRQEYAGCVPAPFDAAPPGLLTVPYTVEPPVLRATFSSNPAVVRDVAPARPSSCRGEAAVTAPPRLQEAAVPLRLVAGLQWLDDVLPVDNDILGRQHFQDYRYAFSPDGTIVPSFRASAVVFIGFTVTLLLMLWWIQWNTHRLFLADLDNAAITPSGSFEGLWGCCTKEERMVMMQIARERIANPYQRQTVTSLLGKGLIRLDPDVQPFSSKFTKFLLAKEQAGHEDLVKWELVDDRHSWRYGRYIVGAVVGGAGLFLLATQPGLQSSFVGVATGVTGLLTAAFKMRDAVGAWFTRRPSGGGA